MEVIFIGQLFFEQNKIGFWSFEYSAEMANGMKQAVFQPTNPVEVQVEFYTERFTLPSVIRNTTTQYLDNSG